MSDAGSSRNPSPAPQRQPSVPRGRRSRSRSLSISEEDAPPRRNQNQNRRRRNKKQLQNINEDNSEFDGVSDDNIHSALVGDPLNGDDPLGGNPLAKPNRAGKLPGVPLPYLGGKKKEESDDGKKDTLKLRLDLNLEVDIRITARVHGDVTLSLL